MEILDANPGEMVYDFLVRAIKEVKNSSCNAKFVKHNDVQIRVYQHSYIEDLCDKFDLQQALNRKNEQYSR